MRKSTLLLLAFVVSLSIKAQETKYFSDNTFTIEISKEEATYKRVSTIQGDTVIFQDYDVSSSSLLSTKKLLDDKPVGIWLNFDFKGELINSRNFSQVKYSNEKIDGVFNNTQNTILEGFTPAEYDGGMREFQKFIATKLVYPNETVQANNKGTIFIRFIIDEKGKPSPHSIVRGVDSFVDYEVWRVIEKMPNWKPAMKDGGVVKSSFTLPIRIS
jgi:hypothetical protein